MKKKLVLDEDNKPVAVLIDYADWLAIESCLGDTKLPNPPSSGIEKFAGILPNLIDGLEYQRMVRDEWQ